MEEGLRTALAEQVRSERMKVELITNVSHDLKTPLTSIISYTELLQQEEGLPDHVQDYIRVLSDKSKRLQVMVRDVFEVSKAATGNLSVDIKPIDFAKLLRQTLADMGEAIEESGLALRPRLPESPVWIAADGDRLYRVFQNLIGNALKYSLEGSRIYLELTAADGQAAAVLRNTSREELPDGWISPSGSSGGTRAAPTGAAAWACPSPAPSPRPAAELSPSKRRRISSPPPSPSP